MTHLSRTTNFFFFVRQTFQPLDFPLAMVDLAFDVPLPQKPSFVINPRCTREDQWDVSVPNASLLHARRGASK